MNWIEIKDVVLLDELHQNSLLDPSENVVIFKHSTRCGTSRVAMKMFEKEWRSDLPVYLVFVVENRQVSSLIEKRYSVNHESPQVLVINGGKCIYNASHSAIDASQLIEFHFSTPPGGSNS